MPFANPRLLVDTEWLALHLHDQGLRIIEATVDPPPEFERIPGAVVVDMRADLGDPRLPFATLPSAERFEEVMSERGVGEGTRVVSYDRRVHRNGPTDRRHRGGVCLQPDTRRGPIPRRGQRGKGCRH